MAEINNFKDAEPKMQLSFVCSPGYQKSRHTICFPSMAHLDCFIANFE
jgi:hypothetical protein